MAYYLQLISTFSQLKFQSFSFTYCLTDRFQVRDHCSRRTSDRNPVSWTPTAEYCPLFPLQCLFYRRRIKYSFVLKRNTILLNRKNERFILQKVWNKIEFSIKFNNFQSLNFLAPKRRVKSNKLSIGFILGFGGQRKVWISLSNIWSVYYISHFQLICLFLVTLKVIQMNFYWK